MVVVSDTQIQDDICADCGDPLARLVDLQEMLALGVMTQQEYDEGPAELLAQI